MENPAELLVKYGPPTEWTGAIAAGLGPERRRLLLRTWKSLSSEEQREIHTKWESTKLAAARPHAAQAYRAARRVSAMRGPIGQTAGMYRLLVPEDKRKKIENVATSKARSTRGLSHVLKAKDNADSTLQRYAKYASRSLRPFFSKEKRRALKKVESHHRSEAPDWAQFLDNTRRKSFAQAVMADSRSDAKLVRHVDQMNRLMTGKKLGQIQGKTGTYDIVRLRGGGLGCTCNDWRYRQSVNPKGEQDCKHIERWKLERGGRRKVAMAPAQASGEGLRPGDIILTTMKPPQFVGNPNSPAAKKAVEQVFRTASSRLQGAYTHSAIYVGGDKVVESRAGEGVKKRSLQEALQDIEGAVVVRPRTSVRKRVNAARFAEKQVGKPYESFPFLVRQAGEMSLPKPLRRLIRRTGTDEADATRFTCSNLIAASYVAQGVSPRSDKKSWPMTAPTDFLHKKRGRLVKVLGAEQKRLAKSGRDKGFTWEKLHKARGTSTKQASLKGLARFLRA